ncbi:hypothetical protein SHKM778_49230 [Streptomyces sp. KM77-8]|uniref:Uncharacterized protein n=1 Tax=Streptomyces haneummycinicus TaxID=3074435 RepID=A0AAT9HM76_9ACTN
MNTQPADADPRPLLGDPLPLDLPNTRWIDDSGTHDLLERPGGLAIWLSSAGLAGIAPDTRETLGALPATRTALNSLGFGGRSGTDRTPRSGRGGRAIGSWLPAALHTCVRVPTAVRA